MKRKNTRQKLILCMVLIAALALLAVGCAKTDPPLEAIPEDLVAIPVGEGEKSFDLVVSKADGSQSAYTVRTNETTVGAALIALGLIEGDVGDFGLYIKTVDGEFHEYESDGKYWAFYVDGALAMSGVDTTDIEEGAFYELRAE